MFYASMELLIFNNIILQFTIYYGAIIYNSAKNNVLNTINPIHNQSPKISLATGAFRTSPVDSILCNAGELPLELRRHSLILKYILRVKSLPNHIISSKILHNPLATSPTNNRNTIFEHFTTISTNIGLQSQSWS